jgi:hypothetical protein
MWAGLPEILFLMFKFMRTFILLNMFMRRFILINKFMRRILLVNKLKDKLIPSCFKVTISQESVRAP